MLKFKYFLLLFISFVAIHSKANTCATAISAACGNTYNGNTSTEPNASIGTCTTSAGTGGMDWYTFVGDGSLWTFETTSASYDTKIWVFSGSCGALTCVTGNDDGGTGTLSLVNFTATSGVTYYVVVGGYSGNQGTYTLAANATPCVAPSPMVYTSSSTFQASTDDVLSCQGTAEIIGIEIVTTGGLSPLDLTSVTVSTSGTSNLSNLSAINIYYSGTSSVFDNSSLFGSGTAGVTSIINGAQTLNGGSNYIWIEYVLNTPTTIGNFLDAQGLSVTVGGIPYIPSTTNPAGNRAIVTCPPSPGAAGEPDVWVKSNVGVTGASPVTSWANQGTNTNVVTFDAPSTSTTLETNLPHMNFHDAVKMGGGYNGTMHEQLGSRSDLINNDEVTMFIITDGAQDLSMSFHSKTSSPNQWYSFAFRHNGLGTIYSGADGTGILYNPSFVREGSNMYGYTGVSGGNGRNTCSGNQTTGSVPSFTNAGTSYELSIGWWPGFGNTSRYTEAIIWNKALTAEEFHKVESYLGIKYGITLGVNGISQDYNSSLNTVVWDQLLNSSYAWDIAGIGRDDISALDQLKSHSVNGDITGGVTTMTFNDILTIANGTNFSSPSSIGTDHSYFLWGHNGGVTQNDGTFPYFPTDNGEVIETIFDRKWKAQETGTVGTVTLEFDLSSVLGVNDVAGANALQYLRLLVDEDGDYSLGATSIAPISYDDATDIVYFQLDFQPTDGDPMTSYLGYYFTLGSTNMLVTPLPAILEYASVEETSCDVELKWKVHSEVDVNGYLIQKSFNGFEWMDMTFIEYDAYANGEYTFMDGSVYEELNYYRIISVDNNGSRRVIKDLIYQNQCNETWMNIYPNPIDNEITINVRENGLIRFTDAKGKLIATFEVNEGMNKVNINNVTAGVYFATFESLSGGVQSIKVIKN